MVALKWQVTSSSLRMVNVVKCEATLSTRASAAIFLEQGQRKETLEFKPACLLTSRCGQFSCLTYIPNFFPRLVYLVLRCVLLFIFYQGSNPHPLHWNHRILTTGSPRKSPSVLKFDHVAVSPITMYLFPISLLFYLGHLAMSISLSSARLTDLLNTVGFPWQNLLI